MRQAIPTASISRGGAVQLSLPARLWQYQQERFPVFKHSVLIASFSFSAICLSTLLRGEVALPSWQSATTAFVCLLLFFLQLRIADEFKDYATDLRYRPERAVPRGLVTLDELRLLGILTILIQALLVLLFHPALLFLLAAVWLYMALMRMEFGLSEWLKAHPFTYLWSHMLVIPLIDLFATACDWLPSRTLSLDLPAGLGWFLLISFLNGVVIEIGRKTWAPEQEREGVESYSSQWGINRSIMVWLMALGLSFLCASFLAWQIDFFVPIVPPLLLFLAVLTRIGVHFVNHPSANNARRIESLSGLWVAVLYLLVGIIPMGVHLWLQ